MLLTAAVSLSLLSHLPRSPREPAATAVHADKHKLYKLGPWLIAIQRDRFAGTVSCQLNTTDVRLQSETLIFRTAPQGDTTHAVYRVDSGPPRRVSEAFGAVEARGFFPQRGWIVDPNGGEAALPVSYVAGAKTVAMQVTPKQHPRRFEVDRLAAAEAAAKGLGCPL